MKLIYVTNARIPTDKAYGLQTVSMCSAFSQCGIEVVLVAPRRKNIIEEDVFSYYHLGRTFRVVYLPIIDAIGIGKRFGFFVTRLSYALSVLFSSLLKKRQDTVIFTRDHIAGLLLGMRRNSVFYDMHGFPETHKWMWKPAMKRMQGIVCTNEWKVEQCKKHFGIAPEKLLCARNGFDASLFESPLSKSEARKKLSLPEQKDIVVYTGHLYDWKGVDTLARAAGLNKDALFVFIGGTDADVARFRASYGHFGNIMLVGQRPHHEIPLFLWAADVLALPNSAHSKQKRFEVYSQFDTSPLKLFEYMASGRPIIASALPSIREILHEGNAVLVAPDDAVTLSRAIHTTTQTPTQGAERAQRALCDVRQYTWNKRAEKIINFMHSQS